MPVRRYIGISILAFVIGLIIGAASGYLIFSPTDSAAPGSHEAVQSSENLTELALRTAQYLKTGDYEALSRLAHPNYGVVFSPRLTVSLRNNRCLSNSDLLSMGSDSALYVWGSAEGGSIPLELSTEDYFRRYVNDHDYVNAKLIGVGYPVKTGNSLDNTAEVFPNAQYVELCYPGTEENDYHDWATLRLVYEELEGAFYLTAVIHSEYVV